MGMGKASEIPYAPIVLAATSLLLFIVSALSGLFVAYAWADAFEKFLALLLGMIAALCIVFVGRFDARLVLLVALAFVAMTLAGNVSVIRLQSQSLQSQTMASVVERFIEPVVICLPLALGWIVCALGRDFYRSDFYHSDIESSDLVIGAIGATLLLMIAAFLIGSGDFSSGLSLLAGVFVAGWLVAQRQLPYEHQGFIRTTNRFLLGMAVVIAALYIGAIASPSTSEMVSAWLPTPIQTRLHHYHDFLAIVADYPFTGSGLGVSEMIYSSYLFMVQVPYTAQAHNLFLQLAVEQGIGGLIGFAGLLVASLWALRQILLQRANFDTVNFTVNFETHPANDYLLATATVGSMVAFIVNGMLDADVYSGPLVCLIFIPIATTWGLFIAHYTRPSRLATSATTSGWSLLVGFAPLALVVAIFFMLGGFATGHANAGAVAQTQAELSVYDSQRWSMQDQVRRTNPEQLYEAERSFDAAIALNPYNVTAHWRLAQIELAQGDYQAAEQHLAQAYAMAPHRRAVRQLLGEIYATQGKVEQAIQLWQPLDVGQNQLQLRQWWYELIGDSDRALNFQETLRIYEQSSCCP